MPSADPFADATGSVPIGAGTGSSSGRDGVITAPSENLNGLPPGFDGLREGDRRQRDIDFGRNLTSILRDIDPAQGNILLIGNTGHPFPEAEAAAAAGFQVVLRTDGVDPNTPGAQELAAQRNTAQLPPPGAYGPFRGLYVGTDAHRDTEGRGRLSADAIPLDPDITRAIVLTEAPFGAVAGEQWTVNPYRDDDLAPLKWYQERGVPVTEFGIDPQSPRQGPGQLGPGIGGPPDVFPIGPPPSGQIGPGMMERSPVFVPQPGTGR